MPRLYEMWEAGSWKWAIPENAGKRRFTQVNKSLQGDPVISGESGAAITMDNSRKTIGFSHAVRGITYALKTQINMRIHFIAAAMALLVAWALRINGLELLWIIMAIFMVIITELINTAVEAIVDLMSPEYHPLARVAKDTAAGAVLLAAIHSLLVAFFVFGRRIL